MCFRSLIFLFIAGCLVFSCSQSNEDNGPSPQNPSPELVCDSGLLVSFDKKASLDQNQVSFILNLADLSMLDTFVRYGIDIYTVEYTSTYRNMTVVCSGMIVQPSDSSAFPIVNINHGTLFSNEDVPSAFDGQLLNLDGLELLASAGFTLCIPDYIGYGSSSSFFHPYYVKDPKSTSVRDMIIATQDLQDSLVGTRSGSLYITGYSEGGYVSMATAEKLKEKPICNTRLEAIAAGAGAYNLSNFMDSILSYDFYRTPAFLGFLTEAYQTHYDWSIPRSFYFNEPYASDISTILDGSNTTLTAVNNVLTTDMNALFTNSLRTMVLSGQSNVFVRAIEENDLGGFIPEQDLRLYHGGEDSTVFLWDSELSYQNMRNSGKQNIDLKIIPGKNHETALDDMLIDVIYWFDSLAYRR